MNHVQLRLRQQPGVCGGPKTLLNNCLVCIVVLLPVMSRQLAMARQWQGNGKAMARQKLMRALVLYRMSA